MANGDLQIATNPQTGKSVALVGGKWQPVDKTAVGPGGSKAYLVGGQWQTPKAAAPLAPVSVTAQKTPAPQPPSAAEMKIAGAEPASASPDVGGTEYSPAAKNVLGAIQRGREWVKNTIAESPAMKAAQTPFPIDHPVHQLLHTMHENLKGMAEDFKAVQASPEAKEIAKDPVGLKLAREHPVEFLTGGYTNTLNVAMMGLHALGVTPGGAAIEAGINDTKKWTGDTVDAYAAAAIEREKNPDKQKAIQAAAQVYKQKADTAIDIVSAIVPVAGAAKRAAIKGIQDLMVARGWASRAAFAEHKFTPEQLQAIQKELNNDAVNSANRAYRRTLEATAEAQSAQDIVGKDVGKAPVEAPKPAAPKPAAPAAKPPEKVQWKGTEARKVPDKPHFVGKVSPQQAQADLANTVREVTASATRRAQGSVIEPEKAVEKKPKPEPPGFTKRKLDAPPVAIREPEAKDLEAKLRDGIHALQENFNPEGLTPKARLGGAVVARVIGARAIAAARRASRETVKVNTDYFESNADKVPEFLERESRRGAVMSDPKLADIKAEYSRRNKEMLKKDNTVFGMRYDTFTPQNMARLFKDGDAALTAMKKRFGANQIRSPQWIAKNYLRAIKEVQDFDRLDLAMSNPEEMMALRESAHEYAHAREDILRRLKDQNLALDKRIWDKQFGEQFGEKVKIYAPDPKKWIPERAPSGKHYYVNAETKKVIDNAFDISDLMRSRYAGAAYKSMAQIKNMIVPLELTMSLFHPLHVMHIDFASGLARAIGPGGGNIKQRLDQLLRTVTFHDSIAGSPDQGWRMIKAYNGLVPASELSDAEKRGLDYIVRGAMPIGLDPVYRAQAERSFDDIFRDINNKKYWSALHLPWAGVAALRKPIFEQWIPSLKVASYLKDVKAFERMRPELFLEENAAELDAHLTRLRKSIDNRYGEMGYSTLFWSPFIKDIAQLNTLSLGWNLGFIREHGGALEDMTHLIRPSFRGGAGPLTIKEGGLHRPLFVSLYNTTALAFGGLMTYMMTGGQVNPFSNLFKTPSAEDAMEEDDPGRFHYRPRPEDFWKDYTHPQTGDYDRDGNPIRTKTPFYTTTEYAAFAKRWQDEGLWPAVREQLLAKEFTGGFGLAGEFATGLFGDKPLDSMGREFADPDSPFSQRLRDTLGEMFYEVEPFAMQSMQRQYGTYEFGELAQRVAEEPKQAAFTVLGGGSAPAYITQSHTEAVVAKFYSEHIPGKQMQYWRGRHAEAYDELRYLHDRSDRLADEDPNSPAAQAADEKYENRKQEIFEEQNWSKDERKSLNRSLRNKYTKYEHMFKTLNWRDQLDLLKKIDPEDRDRYLHIASKEARRKAGAEAEQAEEALDKAKAEGYAEGQSESTGTGE